MRFRDILVHVDNRPTCPTRIDVALNLARQQGARLTGLYVVPHPYYAPRQRDPREEARAAQRRFTERTAASDIETEWICADGLGSDLDLPQLVNLHAHYRDLLVISQTDYDHPERTIPPDLPERAVLGSGRPVLIVPYAGTFATIGRRIMLGWRGGPESARVLHDAMPLLAHAETVRVLSVQGRDGDESYAIHNSDICRHLQRHGVKATGEKLTSGSLRVGDMLLNRVADEGIDLLVIGAFSQTRRGEQTLGEVGRYLLQSMTVPVLMAH